MLTQAQHYYTPRQGAPFLSGRLCCDCCRFHNVSCNAKRIVAYSLFGPFGVRSDWKVRRWRIFVLTDHFWPVNLYDPSILSSRPTIEFREEILLRLSSQPRFAALALRFHPSVLYSTLGINMGDIVLALILRFGLLSPWYHF